MGIAAMAGLFSADQYPADVRPLRCAVAKGLRFERRRYIAVVGLLGHSLFGKRSATRAWSHCNQHTMELHNPLTFNQFLFCLYLWYFSISNLLWRNKSSTTLGGWDPVNSEINHSLNWCKISSIHCIFPPFEVIFELAMQGSRSPRSVSSWACRCPIHIIQVPCQDRVRPGSWQMVKGWVAEKWTRNDRFLDPAQNDLCYFIL